MIEFLFLDLDDTILDFHKAEGIAFRKTLNDFGLEPTESIADRYVVINLEYWQRLERKELTREEVVPLCPAVFGVRDLCRSCCCGKNL